MNTLYSEYLSLKADEPNSLFLFKSGAFYIFLDEDAKFASKSLGLKLTKFGKDTVKCSIAESSLIQYSNILKSLKVNVKVIDSILPYKYSSSEYISIQNSLYILTKLYETDIRILTPEKALNLIKEFKQIIENHK